MNVAQSSVGSDDGYISGESSDYRAQSADDRQTVDDILSKKR